jgi:Xaa-Pro dipeptidase
VLTGERTSYRNDTDRELIFRQESNFFWLSGCDLPGSYLILYSMAPGSYVSHLFIPEEDPLEVLWSPAPPNLAQARTMYDATNIGFSKDFATSLSTILSNNANHMIHVLPSSDLFPSQSAEVTSHFGSATSQYLLDALHQIRLIKDEYEIELIKKANDISSRAHEIVMRLLGEGVRDLSRQTAGTEGVIQSNTPSMPSQWRITKEAEAEAVFVASCRREGYVLTASSFSKPHYPFIQGYTPSLPSYRCCIYTCLYSSLLLQR